MFELSVCNGRDTAIVNVCTLTDAVLITKSLILASVPDSREWLSGTAIQRDMVYGVSRWKSFDGTPWMVTCKPVIAG